MDEEKALQADISTPTALLEILMQRIICDSDH